MTRTTANGIDIEYEEFGSPDDAAVLLIIGFGLQLTGWPDEFCRDLAGRGYRVIRFDNRDTGLSQKFADHGPADIAAAQADLAQGRPVTAPYSEEDMADDAAGLLQSLGISAAHIVGMSMGGRIAQRLALRHAGLVRGLVLMMSHSGHPDNDPGDAAVRQVLFSEPEDADDPHSVADLGLRIFAALRGSGFDYDPDALRRRILDDIERSPDLLGYGRNLLADLAAPATFDRLAGISAATLVLHGAQDPILPVSVAEELASRIAGARLHIVDGMGHEVYSPSLAPLLIAAIDGHCRGR